MNSSPQIFFHACFNRTLDSGCFKLCFPIKKPHISSTCITNKSCPVLPMLFFFLLVHFNVSGQNYDAELLTQKTRIEVTNDKLTKEYLFEIKINNRAGEEFTKIGIPFSKLIKVRNIEAFITDNNNKIVKRLTKNDLTEKSAITNFSFYEDNMVKEFTLKHNTYPYTITYSFQQQESEFLFIDHWIPVISEIVPTKNAELEIVTPIDYQFSYTSNNTSSPVIDSLENNVHYTWTTSYTNIVKPEIYSPPVSAFFPEVIVIPQKFKFEISGSFENWVSFGNWQYKLLTGLNDLPENEKAQVKSLIQNTVGDKEKIRILYHYLQDQTRYINISIDTGGLKPHPASYVSQNKYGDCKALTNYMKAILDFAGIKSYYTKVNAGNPTFKINKEFPSQQFNHIILYIPLENEDIWLDCTSKTAFNYLGTFTQNRDVFVIDHQKSHFLTTPEMTLADSKESRTITFKYNFQEVNANFEYKFYGNMYEKFAMLNSGLNKSEKSRYLRNNFMEYGFELNEYNFKEINRDSTFIEFTCSASARNIYKLLGNEMVIAVIPFSLPQFTKPAERKMPVQIDFPICKTDTLIYDIPAGFILHEKADDFSVKTEFGEYSVQFVQEAAKIFVIKSFKLHAGNYPLNKYDDFYSFYKLVNQKDKNIQLLLIKSI